ncbi:hypothetical protein Ate01nite_45230 [Actinoplanes teichomyceticus]|nr:hypothetical protein Ate01nite_45230 [Actinoplanes teichomyceticus]
MSCPVGRGLRDGARPLVDVGGSEPSHVDARYGNSFPPPARAAGSRRDRSRKPPAGWRARPGAPLGVIPACSWPGVRTASGPPGPHHRSRGGSFEEQTGVVEVR